MVNLRIFPKCRQVRLNSEEQHGPGYAEHVCHRWWHPGYPHPGLCGLIPPLALGAYPHLLLVSARVGWNLCPAGPHTHGSQWSGQSWVFLLLMAITAGDLRSSRSMPAVCSFQHVWEKKMAFSYYIFARGLLLSQGFDCAKGQLARVLLQWQLARSLQTSLGCFPQGQD